MSATFRSPKATVTTPNVSEGKGRRWASPSDQGDPAVGAGPADLRAADQEHLAAEVGPDDRRLAPAGAVVGQGEVRRPVQQSSTGTPGIGGTVAS